MEISEVLAVAQKQLADINGELGFKKESETENSVTFSGEKGAYRITFDAANSLALFDCAYAYDGSDESFKTVSKSLFDADAYDEKDAKSFANEVADEIGGIFNKRKKVDLEKVKMPKAVSRTKAKNGVVSYDCDSLANRFGTLYPEMKQDIKENVAKYGEFLPETFFAEHGTKKVLDVIESGSDAERKKLFKMLNEIYEDGTNEVQDVIGVTILGEMKNDKRLMDIADRYMSDYMSGPVHEINKITAKKNKYTKRLANPPAYKPKKKKKSYLDNALQSQNTSR